MKYKVIYMFFENRSKINTYWDKFTHLLSPGTIIMTNMKNISQLFPSPLGSISLNIDCVK